ncbi:MAG: ABC transporter permease [Trueperaceae bacterium]|nr:MAG: ABC transporter permease [Trueperaceae bacterium]
MSTQPFDDTGAVDARTNAAEERYYLASSWTLMRRRFMKHKLALVGGTVLLVVYFFAIFAGFFSVADPFERHPDHTFAPPTRVRLFHEGRLHRPFVYGLKTGRHPVTRAKVFEIDREQLYPIRFFVAGHEYRLLGLFPNRVHFIGVDEPGVLFLFGTENLGRDMFSRVLHGARISLSIGLVGVAISFFLGCLLGGVSGYFGGWIDTVIQRVIEFLQSLPTIPLWMGLAAAVPITWPQTRTYFVITLILSILGWTGLARVVRGKLLQLREEDYVMAARVYGASDMRIITRHLLPGFMSYLIVHLTLAIPFMILGETALSFIGIGLRPPVISWGVMLQQAQNVRTVSLQPWLLIPGLCVVIVVLCFNFVGDGLRDAADPYK